MGVRLTFACQRFSIVPVVPVVPIVPVAPISTEFPITPPQRSTLAAPGTFTIATTTTTATTSLVAAHATLNAAIAGVCL